MIFGFEVDGLSSVPFNYCFGKAGFSRLYLVKTKHARLSGFRLRIIVPAGVSLQH